MLTVRISVYLQTMVIKFNENHTQNMMQNHKQSYFIDAYFLKCYNKCNGKLHSIIWVIHEILFTWTTKCSPKLHSIIKMIIMVDNDLSGVNQKHSENQQIMSPNIFKRELEKVLKIGNLLISWFFQINQKIYSINWKTINTTFFAYLVKICFIFKIY